MADPLTIPDRARLAVLRLDRSAAMGLGVVAVVAIVVVAFLAIRGRPHEVTFTGDGSAAVVASAAAGSAPPPASGSAEGEVVVDVAGRVRRPGLVRVPAGSRVADVVEAAGGFKKASDAASLNQARVVSDGEQVVVGPGGPPAPGGGGAGGGSTGSSGGPVDLNAATLEQLESLPGVGPVLAQRILDHRTANGRFGSVDELRDVSGIGEKKFADIAPHARV